MRSPTSALAIWKACFRSKVSSSCFCADSCWASLKAAAIPIGCRISDDVVRALARPWDLALPGRWFSLFVWVLGFGWRG